jgi:putative nucleotidyltransferase with HDIG domain
VYDKDDSTDRKRYVNVINRDYIRHVFEQYVSEFDAGDPKIKLKTDHTYRVAKLAGQIAADAGLDEDLAWLSGMLHDIGRFEQVRRYATFKDAASIDHAVFGADMLFREGFIDRFHINADLDEREMQILELSIRYHSMYRLPEDRPELERQYCDVLRDADKLDIFRVHCKTPFEDIYNVTTKELYSSEISDEVKACFRNRTAVLKMWKKTPADYVASLPCLVFELVYPVSRKLAFTQGYLEQILSFTSDNPETEAWFRYMRDSMRDMFLQSL